MSIIYEEIIQCGLRLKPVLLCISRFQMFLLFFACFDNTQNSQCLAVEGQVICDLCQESSQKCLLFNRNQALWVLSVACCRLQ